MAFHSQHHSFDIHLAAKFGVKRAILIHHFQHWIRFNRKRKKNLIEGKCWSYQSKTDIEAHFPYMTYDSIKHNLAVLVEKGVLITGNFNKKSMDNTNWYAFADEKAFGVDDDSIQNMEISLRSGENPQRSGENPRAIPDTIKEDSNVRSSQNPSESSKSSSSKPKTTVESDKMAQKLYDRVKANFPKIRPPDLSKWSRELRLMNERDKISWTDIEELIDWSTKDSFWMKNILSACALRKHYDKLYAQMRKSPTRKKYKPDSTPRPEWKSPAGPPSGIKAVIPENLPKWSPKNEDS